MNGTPRVQRRNSHFDFQFIAVLVNHAVQVNSLTQAYLRQGRLRMESVLLFIFGCMLCLMFLGMLYGERLSLLGLFDGEWLSPIGVLVGRMWDGLCEAIDTTIDFVLAHLAWVVAAVSGTAGLILVAFLMGGGLASDAAAFHRDTLTPLRTGGVIDQIPKVAAQTSQTSIILASSERADSDLLTQARTIDYLVFDRPEYEPFRPRPRRPIDGTVVDYPASRPITDRPDLDVTFQRLGSSVIRPEFNPNVVTPGRLAEPLPDGLFIDRILRRLRKDDWRESVGLPGNVPAERVVGMPESPLAAVRDLESRVQVIPGILVAEHDLRVQKTVPKESTTGELTIQISLTNLSNQTIDGLLVREILPLNTVVRGAVPEGLLRDGTLTWLVDDLRPAEESMLRVTVLPSNSTRPGSARPGSARPGNPRSAPNSLFESMTEVSALTAVTTRTEVTREEMLEDPFPSIAPRREAAPIERREFPPRPEVAGEPELQLVIEDPGVSASVGEWTQIRFTLSNRGTAEALDVKLRLTLDQALDHSELINRPTPERQVFVTVARLGAGESKRFRLEVRPNTSAETISTAEVLYAGAQVDLQTFRLAAREKSSPRPAP